MLCCGSALPLSLSLLCCLEAPYSDACNRYSGSDKEERKRKIKAILEAKKQERQRLQQVDAEKRREA